MSNRQYPSSVNPARRCSRNQRLVAGLVFLALAGGGVVLWLSATGVVNLGFFLGVCGFKQRFGLPCPGCGWTRSVQYFLTGHPIRAFVMQPAAAFFSVLAALTAIFALLMAVFGINFVFLRRWYRAVGLKTLIIGMVIVFLAGWCVMLSRVLFAGNGV